MTEIIPVTPTTTQGMRWKRLTNYQFAANDMFCPLVVHEAVKAMQHFPIAFIKNGNKFELIALQGLQKSKNLYVGSAGTWLAPYVPAHYRGHPFLLANTSNGDQVLCFNKSSGLLTEDESAQLFFNADNSPTTHVMEILNFLSNLYKSHQETTSLCAELDMLSLFEPWPLDLKLGAAQMSIEGVFRINEPKLKSLPADSLLSLHQSSAMSLIYCQLLSMQNLQSLISLHNSAPRHAAIESTMPPSAKIDLSTSMDSGTLNFDKL